MSRFSWSRGAPNGRPQDLQQIHAIDQESPTLKTEKILGDSLSSSAPTPEDVSTLLRSWGRDRRDRLMRHVEIDLWSQLSQDLKDSLE